MVRATTSHGELRIEDNSFLRRGVCTIFDMVGVSYALGREAEEEEITNAATTTAENRNRANKTVLENL